MEIVRRIPIRLDLHASRADVLASLIKRLEELDTKDLQVLEIVAASLQRHDRKGGA